MVIETPNQSEIVLKCLNSKTPLDWPIIKRYPGYECCFLALHPFLIVKEGGKNVKIPYHPFPKKNEIVKNYNRLNWSEFLAISEIKDIQSLDDCLAFYHRARRFTNKNEYEKLIRVTEKENSIIVEAQVDCLPAIIEDSLLNYFVKKGYSELYIYDDIHDEKELFKIDALFKDELSDIHHIRIESPDHKILIVEDFDERFTYFFSNKTDIKRLTEELNLEGFYCDEFTTSAWSYDILPEDISINWDQDMERFNSAKLIN